MKINPGKGKIILIMLFLLVAFLVVFYFVTNREKKEELTRLSATEATIQRDLSINYPQTPKAVVRYYAELSQCMYDPTNSDEEIQKIASQSRLLFDEKLKAQQTDQEYLSSLRSTIAAFIKDNRKIVSFTVSPSSEVVYKTLDIGESASLYCTYTMQKGSVSYSDPEHFLLRKDGEGRWKILGWQSASLDNAASADSGGAPAPAKEETGSGGAPAPVEEETVDGTSPEGTEKPAEQVTPEIKIPEIEKPTVEIEIPGVNR